MTFVTRCAYRWLCAALLIAGLSTGCASVRPAATTLASEGGTAARTMEAAFAKTEADLDLMVDRRIMQAALTGRNAPSEQALEDIARVSDAMTARRRLCGDLGALYDGFSALAAYDASTGVTTAFGEVTAGANELALALGDSAAVSAPMADLTQRLAGAAAAGIQNAKLRDTSAVIRESLREIRKLVAMEAYLHRSVRGELERAGGGASIALFRSGIGRPHPLLRELIDDREFSYDEKQVNNTLERGDKSEAIDSAIAEIVRRRVARRIELETAVVEGFASVLMKLEMEHLAFEAKQPLDLSGLAQRLAALREMVDLITETKRPPAEAGGPQP